MKMSSLPSYSLWIRKIEVNNIIVWMSNWSSHNICLRLIERNSRLKSRLIDFCCMFGFATKLIDDFLLIIVIGRLDMLIIIC